MRYSNDHPDQAIAPIFSRLKSSDRPYVITGSQVSYRYHRWLSPAPKVVELRIFPEDYAWWKNFLRDVAGHVSDVPPMSTMMENLDAAIIVSKNSRSFHLSAAAHVCRFALRIAGGTLH